MPTGSSSSHRVVVQPAGTVLAVDHNETLMRAAQRLGYRWPTLCHGEGSCTICAVVVLGGAGALSPPRAAEIEAMRFGNVAARSEEPVRLACQARVLGDLVVHKKGVKKILMTDQKGNS